MTAYEYGNFLADFILNFNKERYNKLVRYFDIEPEKKIKTYSTG